MRAGFHDGPRNHPRQLISTNNGVVGGVMGFGSPWDILFIAPEQIVLSILKEHENQKVRYVCLRVSCIKMYY